MSSAFAITGTVSIATGQKVVTQVVATINSASPTGTPLAHSTDPIVALISSIIESLSGAPTPVGTYSLQVNGDPNGNQPGASLTVAVTYVNA
jgi:hypothetical protein